MSTMQCTITDCRYHGKNNHCRLASIKITCNSKGEFICNNYTPKTK